MSAGDRLDIKTRKHYRVSIPFHVPRMKASGFIVSALIVPALLTCLQQRATEIVSKMGGNRGIRNSTEGKARLSGSRRLGIV